MAVEGKKDDEDLPLLPIDPAFKNVILVSYMEIYNEEIFDLLADPEQPKKKLKVTNKNGVFGLSEKTVYSLKQAMSLLEQGRNARKTAQTLLNVDSSRSHCIFTIKFCRVPKNVDKELVKRVT